MLGFCMLHVDAFINLLPVGFGLLGNSELLGIGRAVGIRCRAGQPDQVRRASVVAFSIQVDLIEVVPCELGVVEGRQIAGEHVEAVETECAGAALAPAVVVEDLPILPDAHAAESTDSLRVGALTSLDRVVVLVRSAGESFGDLHGAFYDRILVVVLGLHGVDVRYLNKNGLVPYQYLVVFRRILPREGFAG
jgi:hypothetical protein